jgi:hypothetical protein
VLIDITDESQIRFLHSSDIKRKNGGQNENVQKLFTYFASAVVNFEVHMKIRSKSIQINPVNFYS